MLCLIYSLLDAEITFFAVVLHPVFFAKNTYLQFGLKRECISLLTNTCDGMLHTPAFKIFVFRMFTIFRAQVSVQGGMFEIQKPLSSIEAFPFL